MTEIARMRRGDRTAQRPYESRSRSELLTAREIVGRIRQTRRRLLTLACQGFDDVGGPPLELGPGGGIDFSGLSGWIALQREGDRHQPAGRMGTVGLELALLHELAAGEGHGRQPEVHRLGPAVPGM